MQQKNEYERKWKRLREWLEKKSKDTSFYDEFAVMKAVLRQMDSLEKAK